METELYGVMGIGAEEFIINDLASYFGSISFSCDTEFEFDYPNEECTEYKVTIKVEKLEK